MERKTVQEWADKFSLEIIDWDAHDFYEDKIVTFSEFAHKVSECTIYGTSRRKWKEFLYCCERYG